MLRVCLTTCLLVIGFLSPSLPAHADKAEIYTSVFSSTAIGGYDAVSYFSDTGPEKGSSSFSMAYKGVNWRFANQENLDAFKAAPEKYIPQYGGYCAWAISQGYTAKGSPTYWKIVEDKLYLNYNKSVQDDWEADIPGFIALANENWPSVLQE